MPAGSIRLALVRSSEGGSIPERDKKTSYGRDGQGARLVEPAEHLGFDKQPDGNVKSPGKAQARSQADLGPGCREAQSQVQFGVGPLAPGKVAAGKAKAHQESFETLVEARLEFHDAAKAQPCPDSELDVLSHPPDFFGPKSAFRIGQAQSPSVRRRFRRILNWRRRAFARAGWIRENLGTPQKKNGKK